MKKHLSFEYFFKNIKHLWTRFPGAAGASLVVMIAGISRLSYTLEQNRDYYESLFEFLEKTVLLGVFAFFLFTLGTLILEKYKANGIIKAFSRLGIVIAVALYGWFLPENIQDMHRMEIYRHVFYHILLGLGILTVPYIDKKSLAIWKYGKRLVSRLFMSSVFSLTLLLSIYAALASIDYLFEADWIRDNLYGQFFVLVSSLFLPWLFMSKFPSKLYEKVKAFAYPKILRLFVVDLLFPIMAVFFFILYIYTGKIVFTWDWPKGGVAYWVIAYSSAGILTFLLGYPLQAIKKYAWTKRAFQAIFTLIIPLSIVLFLAIGIRIGEYGITERRYLVVVLGAWLLAISFYYLFSKAKKLKIIPISLFIIFALSLFGPWSMFSVSLKSQENEFVSLMKRTGLMVGEKIVTSDEPIEMEREDFNSLSSKMCYFASFDKLDRLENYFPADYKETAEKNKELKKDNHHLNYFYCYYNELDEMKNFFQLKIKDGYKETDEINSIYFQGAIKDLSKGEQGIDVTGYDTLFNVFSSEKGGYDYILADGTKLRVLQINKQVEFYYDEELQAQIDLNEKIKEWENDFIRNRYGRYVLPEEKGIIELSGDTLGFKLLMENIYFFGENKDRTELIGKLLVKKK